MARFGLVLALVLPRLAVVAFTDDYPELTFNMTFPPITDILQFDHADNWTAVPSDIDRDGFSIQGLAQEKGGAGSHFRVRYIGSALYLSGVIPGGRSTDMWVWNDGEGQKYPWSDSQPNLVPGFNGTGLQESGIIMEAEYGGEPSETTRLHPWFYLRNITITSSMRSQAYVNGDRELMLIFKDRHSSKWNIPPKTLPTLPTQAQTLDLNGIYFGTSPVSKLVVTEIVVDKHRWPSFQLCKIFVGHGSHS